MNLMSTAPARVWTRPETALAWQKQQAVLTQRLRHLAYSSQCALWAGAGLCVASWLVPNRPISLSLSGFLALLFLYPLCVDQLSKGLKQSIEKLTPADPDPAQLTRWQRSAEVVRYRQACLASGVPLLKGDAQWMDHMISVASSVGDTPQLT